MSSQVQFALELIGSAVVGKLSEGWLVCPWLKWVAPVEVTAAPGTAPLEPAASLVLLLATLEIADSMLTVFDAVGKLWL